MPPPPSALVEFRIYDPDDRGVDWLLTLQGCALEGDGECRVELAR